MTPEHYTNSLHSSSARAADYYRQSRNDGWKHAEVLSRLHEASHRRWRIAFLAGGALAFALGLMIGAAYL